MNINRLFDKRFKGCPLLATMEDEARGRTVKIFYIEQPTLVGVWDGVDTWISAVKGCFRNLKEGLLESQIALAAEGKIAPEVAQRRKLVVPLPRKVPQRREMTH
jgi:hypothetical protein